MIRVYACTNFAAQQAVSTEVMEGGSNRLSRSGIRKRKASEVRASSMQHQLAC